MISIDLIPDSNGINKINLYDLFYESLVNLPELALSKNCVYIIYNIKLNSAYIGQTINLLNRFRYIGSAHRKFYSSNKNYELYRSIHINGFDDFYVGILELNVSEDYSREIYWIDYYKDKLYLYNKTSGGLSGDQFHSKEILDRYGGKLPFNIEVVYKRKVLNSIRRDFTLLESNGIKLTPYNYYYHEDDRRYLRLRRLNRILSDPNYWIFEEWEDKERDLFNYYILNGIPDKL